MPDIRSLLEAWDWPTPSRDVGWCSVRCGAHDDHHPSARVNVELGAFVCFSCGLKAGSPVSLVMAVHGWPYPRACEYLAEHGIPPTADAAAAPTGGRRRPFRQKWHKRTAWRGGRR